MIIIMLGIYDWIASSLGLPYTISRCLYDQGTTSAAIPFVFGYIAGHVFGYMTPTIEAALRPALDLPMGWTITIVANNGGFATRLVSPIGQVVSTQSDKDSDIDALVKIAKGTKV